MKKYLFFAFFLIVSSFTFGQKTGFVDTEYILSNIPAFKDAQEQIDILSKQWQKEIEDRYDEMNKQNKQFEIDKLLFTDDMKFKKEQEIAKMEKDVKDLQRKRFGIGGDRFKKEQELMKPIQDEIFGAIKDISFTGNYGMVFDASSKSGIVMVFSDPKYDLSEDVLKKLGYIK